jgi:hypothetical protein
MGICVYTRLLDGRQEEKTERKEEEKKKGKSEKKGKLTDCVNRKSIFGDEKIGRVGLNLH